MQIFWRDSMRDAVAEVGKPGGGTSRLITDERFQGWREFWLPRFDAFHREVKLALPGYMVSLPGLDLLEQIIANSLVQGFHSWLVSSNPSPTMHVATFYVGELDALFTRYEAALKLGYKRAPSRGVRLWTWLRGRPDWLETHPKNLWVLAGIVALVLAWQFPLILQRITDLVRAVRGG